MCLAHSVRVSNIGSACVYLREFVYYSEQHGRTERHGRTNSLAMGEETYLNAGSNSAHDRVRVISDVRTGLYR